MRYVPIQILDFDKYVIQIFDHYLVKALMKCPVLVTNSVIIQVWVDSDYAWCRSNLFTTVSYLNAYCQNVFLTPFTIGLHRDIMSLLHLALIITKRGNTSCIDHIRFKYVIRGHNWQPQDVTACVDNRVAPSVVIQGNLVWVVKAQHRSWGEAQGRDGSCPCSEYQELFKGFSTFIFCNANKRIFNYALG